MARTRSPLGRGSGIDQGWESLSFLTDFQEDLDVAMRQGVFDERRVGRGGPGVRF